MFVEGDICYLGVGVNYGAIRVVDISNPEVPSQISVLSFEHSVPNRIIMVGDYLYVAGTEGLSIIDASNPNNLSIAHVIEVNDSYFEVDIFEDYLVAANQTDKSIEFYNISDPENPIVAGVLQEGLGMPMGLAIRDANYLYASFKKYQGEGVDALRIMDWSDPLDIKFMSIIEMNNPVRIRYEEPLVYVLDGYRFKIIF